MIRKLPAKRAARKRVALMTGWCAKALNTDINDAHQAADTARLRGCRAEGAGVLWAR